VSRNAKLSWIKARCCVLPPVEADWSTNKHHVLAEPIAAIGDGHTTGES
jgi:hypothetical protein